MTEPHHVQVFGSGVSYYTGKLEAYLRYKGIPYDRGSPYERRAEMEEAVGIIQHPMARLADGRWMTDSTPMIQFLEAEQSSPGIMPPDPVVRFLALLIEDYADEWLWRPAMHYRWSYRRDREFLSSTLADELGGASRLPRFVRRRFIQARQRVGFVIRDGVNGRTRAHVEGSYRAALANMSEMLGSRPFLLGDAPSIADFGLMGPMLRHFGQDPTPAEIMRNEGPAVYAWVARMWNAHGRHSPEGFLDEFPQDGASMIREISETHLVQLRANADAWAAGKRRFKVEIQGCRYAGLPTSQYRVWCLEQLRDGFAALEAPAQETARSLLDSPHAEILWGSAPQRASGYDVDERAPFNRAINVYEGAVPLR